MIGRKKRKRRLSDVQVPKKGFFFFSLPNCFLIAADIVTAISLSTSINVPSEHLTVIRDMVCKWKGKKKNRKWGKSEEGQKK
jgi:hypothetical protein